MNDSESFKLLFPDFTVAAPLADGFLREVRQQNLDILRQLRLRRVEQVVVRYIKEFSRLSLTARGARILLTPQDDKGRMALSLGRELAGTFNVSFLGNEPRWLENPDHWDPDRNARFLTFREQFAKSWLAQVGEELVIQYIDTLLAAQLATT